MGEAIGMLMLLVLFVAGLFLYLLPTYVAHRREHANFTAILVLNVLLGWSLIGWVAAMVWACTAQEAAAKPVQAEPSWMRSAPLPAHIPGAVKPVTDERECPYCAELIKVKAKVCKHCGRDVDPVVSA